MITEYKKETILKSVKDWIANYENEKEHDNDFCIELKDSAYELFVEIKEACGVAEIRNATPEEAEQCVIFYPFSV